MRCAGSIRPGFVTVHWYTPSSDLATEGNESTLSLEETVCMPLSASDESTRDQVMLRGPVPPATHLSDVGLDSRTAVLGAETETDGGTTGITHT